MLRFKRFDHATVTLAGVEFVHQIKERQFALSTRFSSEECPSQRCDAVLAASETMMNALSIAGALPFALEPPELHLCSENLTGPFLGR
jgi:hypothetical protein